eukprot:m.185792 g.185792  ORF g.185792 m.185792 type:complete len:189 (+) comp14736_c0_seq1:394-960(+)
MEPNSSTPTGREAVHEGWHARLILSGVQAGVAGWATYMAWQAFQSSVSITLGTQTGSGTPRVLIGSSITLPADEALAIADGSDVSQTVSAGLPAIKGASQSAKGASQALVAALGFGASSAGSTTQTVGWSSSRGVRAVLLVGATGVFAWSLWRLYHVYACVDDSRHVVAGGSHDLDPESDGGKDKAER